MHVCNISNLGYSDDLTFVWTFQFQSHIFCTKQVQGPLYYVFIQWTKNGISMSSKTYGLGLSGISMFEWLVRNNNHKYCYYYWYEGYN